MAVSVEFQLLFGHVALQNGLVDKGQLVAAFQAWSLDRGRLLADHLVSRGDLDAEDRVAVDALVARHLKRRGDVEKSPSAVTIRSSTLESMANLGDPQIVATLCRVGSGHSSTDDGDPDRTPEFRSRLALTHKRIGFLHSRTGKPVDAMESYQWALEIGQMITDW